MLRVRASWLLPMLAALVLPAAIVWGYAEEPLLFVDPVTKATGDQQVSTLHNELTYALALAAGFSDADARTLQIYNQLVDSEILGLGATIWYDNRGGSFPATPVPTTNDVCAPSIRPILNSPWPMWGDMSDPNTAITSRFGPYSPFFHFPRGTADELGSLKEWGWGRSSTLRGYEAYAWNGATVAQAACRYVRWGNINTTLSAGSLAAFATYLHSLADSYSHRECIKETDAGGLEWPTHTLDDTYPACKYNPNNPTNSDAHGREFGVAYPADSARTDEAIRAVYAELAARSRAREGIYVPLALTTVLTGVTGQPTLDDALSNWVHTWAFDQPTQRREYAAQIGDAAKAQRTARTYEFVYEPLVLRQYP